MTHANSSRNAHDWQARKSQNDRVRRIARASLYLNGALILLTYLPIGDSAAVILALTSLAVSLIGIGSIVRLIWAAKSAREASNG